MKIGDLAKATGTKVETVRFYEKLGLIPLPQRSSGNYRIYRKAHLNRLSFIRRSREIGFSLDDIRELLALSDNQKSSCASIDQIASKHLQLVRRKIADLVSVESELERLVSECKQGTVSDCMIIETLSAMG